MSGNFKITTVGDAGVGKTSLSLRYVKEIYVDVQDSTIGAAFLTKKIKFNDNTIRDMLIWDTAGQERFHSLVPMYLRDADAVLYMFDMSDLSTLENIFKIWTPLVNRVTTNKECVYYIIGNKYDLITDPKNSQQLDFKKIVKDKFTEYSVDISNIRYYETSAVSGHNVDQLFENLVDDISKLRQEEEEKKIEVLDLSKESTSYCCY
jgi:small GTP-binding protein